MDPFQCEDLRLASFANFPDIPGIDPTNLAAAGFCYLGVGDEVSCFKCKVTYKCWKPHESPQDVHMQISGQCEFVKQMRQSNHGSNVNIIPPWSNQKNNNNSTSSSNYKEASEEPKTKLQKNQRRSFRRTKEASEEPKTKHPRYDNRSSSSIFIGKPYVSPVPAYHGFLKHRRLKQFSQDKASTGLLFIDEYSKNEQESIGNDQRQGENMRVTQEPYTARDTDNKVKDQKLNECTVTIRRLEEKIQNLTARQTCKVCMDKPVEIVFLPCSHLAACVNCVPALKKCPICRTVVKEKVKAILS